MELAVVLVDVAKLDDGRLALLARGLIMARVPLARALPARVPLSIRPVSPILAMCLDSDARRGPTARLHRILLVA